MGSTVCERTVSVLMAEAEIYGPTRQTLDHLTDAFTKAGVDPKHKFSDKMSGARNDRPGLNAASTYVGEGDTLTVVALDRFGRSLSGIIGNVRGA